MQMDREQIERRWFVRFVTVLMVAAIMVGAAPVAKSIIFPAEKSRR
jgi:hypothetical protein